MGYFYTESALKNKNWLASEVGAVKRTYNFDPDALSALITTDDKNNKVIRSGRVYPSNDANAIGIVFSDVDVTYGVHAGSVMVAGRIYPANLLDTLSTAATTALTAAGFVMEVEPLADREVPYTPHEATAGSRAYTVATNFVAGDTVALEGYVFSAVAADATPGVREFAIGASAAASAVNLRAAIASQSGISNIYNSTVASGVITLTEIVAGGGNTPGEADVTGTGVITNGTATESAS